MAATVAQAPVAGAAAAAAPLPTAVLGTLEGHEGSVMAVRYNGAASDREALLSVSNRPSSRWSSLGRH